MIEITYLFQFADAEMNPFAILIKHNYVKCDQGRKGRKAASIV